MCKSENPIYVLIVDSCFNLMSQSIISHTALNMNFYVFYSCTAVFQVVLGVFYIVFGTWIFGVTFTQAIQNDISS